MIAITLILLLRISSITKPPHEFALKLTTNCFYPNHEISPVSCTHICAQSIKPNICIVYTLSIRMFSLIHEHTSGGRAYVCSRYEAGNKMAHLITSVLKLRLKTAVYKVRPIWESLLWDIRRPPHFIVATVVCSGKCPRHSIKEGANISRLISQVLYHQCEVITIVQWLLSRVLRITHAGDIAPHSLSPHAHAHGFRWRTLFVGLVHGMAGSAALLVLAVSQATSTGDGLLYVILFGLGSMVGMASLSSVIAVPLVVSANTVTWANRVLQLLVGGATIGIGAATFYATALMMTR